MVVAYSCCCWPKSKTEGVCNEFVGGQCFRSCASSSSPSSSPRVCCGPNLSFRVAAPLNQRTSSATTPRAQDLQDHQAIVRRGRASSARLAPPVCAFVLWLPAACTVKLLARARRPWDSRLGSPGRRMQQQQQLEAAARSACVPLVCPGGGRDGSGASGTVVAALGRNRPATLAAASSKFPPLKHKCNPTKQKTTEILLISFVGFVGAPCESRTK